MFEKKELVKQTVAKRSNSEKIILSSIKRSCSDALIRTNMVGTEIIWNRKDYYFSNQRGGLKQKKLFNKGMCLFNMVKSDATKYVETHKIKLPKKNPVNYINPLFDMESEITLLDVNNAYWHIAYNLGIISEKTYKKGITPVIIESKKGYKYTLDFKSIRLASLANLGAVKKYNVIENGTETDKFVIIKNNAELQNAYKLIRYTCYKYMKKVSKLLGNDFCKWETDSVIFKDTPENNLLVQNYFTKIGLSLK